MEDCGTLWKIHLIVNTIDWFAEFGSLEHVLLSVSRTTGDSMVH